MATTRLDWNAIYIGLSTDPKPAAPADDVPEGSIYLEVNTDTKHIYHNGTWYAVTF